MDAIKVNVDELLKTIRENRDRHRTEFEQAQTGYRERVIEELDRRLADARANRKIVQQIGLPVPEDHTKDYDRVIRMLEMSVERVIELGEHEFAQYVMDDWSWKATWALSNRAYIAKSQGLEE